MEISPDIILLYKGRQGMGQRPFHLTPVLPKLGNNIVKPEKRQQFCLS
ncbi:MAG: hypothetical protein BWY93_02068 [Euryarchaeota archaeon ADurb.BinA087]|nr:MAG: hypothetical protein BWY93_02068 [Euryarchaeota archaeon ADurb.BinA087]